MSLRQTPSLVVALALLLFLFLPVLAPSAQQVQQPPSNQQLDGASSDAAPMDTIQAPLAPLVTRLSKDEQALLILNRFTYGPRPGDLEHLRDSGMQAWFAAQLNPQRIDDSALDRRLADYPAMKLSIRDMMEQYPDNGTIRAAAAGRVSIPFGNGEKQIYQTQMDRYRDKGEKKKAEPRPQAEALDPAPLPATPQAILAMDPKPRFDLIIKLTRLQQRLLERQLPASDRDRLTEGFTPRQIEALAALGSPESVIRSELVETKILRCLYSERQLNEVMVDFWLNHFNVYIRKNQQAPYFIAAFERDTIRPRALGNFEALLVATATSPAMLTYLDNFESIGPHSPAVEQGPGYWRRQVPKKAASGLNENYARELMELHTLGVNGGYTQHDVTEVARVFTGWTIGRPGYDQGQPSRAEFDRAKHEPGDKTVLGTRIKDDGMAEGMKVLHLLATSPQTAAFISRKLAVRFVSDDPPPALVDRMATAFLKSHGDIRATLIAMINAPEFFTSATLRAKVKTPQDYVLSAVRASSAEVASAGALSAAIADLGMPLYGHQTPDGYSMRADPWNSTASLVARMNFALALSSNRVPGVRTDWPALLALPQGENLATLDPETKDKLLEQHILHLDASERTRHAILAQINVDPAQQRASLNQISTQKSARKDALATLHNNSATPRSEPLDPQTALAAGLLFGSPEFQRR